MGGQRYGTRLRFRNVASARTGWAPGMFHIQWESLLARHCRPAVAWLPLWQAQVVGEGCPLLVRLAALLVSKLAIFLYYQMLRGITDELEASGCDHPSHC